MSKRSTVGGNRGLVAADPDDPDLPPIRLETEKSSALTHGAYRSDLEAARAFIRPHLSEILGRAVADAKRGGGRALTFVRDVMGFSQALMSVQVVVSQTLGISLDEAQEKLAMLKDLPENADEIATIDAEYLGWYVKAHPEQAERIRTAIFGDEA